MADNKHIDDVSALERLPGNLLEWRVAQLEIRQSELKGQYDALHERLQDVEKRDAADSQRDKATAETLKRIEDELSAIRRWMMAVVGALIVSLIMLVVTLATHTKSEPPHVGVEQGETR